VLRKQWNGRHLEAECSDRAVARPERRSSDYTHVAFDVAQADFAGLVQQLLAAGARTWKDNRSEGDSFYFLDPDGHKLEIHVGSLDTRLKAMER
jgi:catechol 2,3-dioxygenase-like lactoylglutathione lyase family enzyme